jgi:hypothetical protein
MNVPQWQQSQYHFRGSVWVDPLSRARGLYIHRKPTRYREVVLTLLLDPGGKYDYAHNNEIRRNVGR